MKLTSTRLSLLNSYLRKKKQLKVLGILINYQREFAHGFLNERKRELADFTLVYNHASSTDNSIAGKSICFNHGYN